MCASCCEEADEVIEQEINIILSLILFVLYMPEWYPSRAGNVMSSLHTEHVIPLPSHTTWIKSRPPPRDTTEEIKHLSFFACVDAEMHVHPGDNGVNLRYL